MGQAFPPPISPALIEWIQQQKIFFVATAPMTMLGHVNLSPKSAAQLRVSNDGNFLYYLDFTGSGSETSAHLMDSDGRITIMLTSFEASPRICRVFGKGIILTKKILSSDFGNSILSLFNPLDVASPGFRWIIQVQVTRVSTSCGYSVPYYKYLGERNTLNEWNEKKGLEGLEEYRSRKNFFSIDGLFACPEMNMVPTKVVDEEGYLICDYDGRKNQISYKIMFQRFLWNLRFKSSFKNGTIFGIIIALIIQKFLKL